MKFPYQLFEGEHLPIIPVSLKSKEGWVEFDAYIDTGASFCLFPADVAEILGLCLEEGEVRKMILGDGNALTVYLHNLPVLLAGKEFAAPIGFSKGLGISFAIIGRRGIFDQFTVCFNELEKWIEFTPSSGRS